MQLQQEVNVHDFETIYIKWRKILLRTNIYVAILIFMIEVLMFFFLRSANLIVTSIDNYLISYLFLPTAANILIILAGMFIIRKLPPESLLINYIPAVQQVLIGMVVASTHYVFSATLCVFCLPIFATIVFSDKRVTRNVGFLCFLALTFEMIVRQISPFRLYNEGFFAAEGIVAYTILIATAMICNVLIDFQKEKSLIIQQSYLRQLEMKDQLYKDQKTGLYGHTIFMNTLDHLVKLAERTNLAFALAIIDIDDFKKINDNYGHLKGDQVIFALANLLKREFCENLFTARFGGEEFAIIFSESQVEHAEEFLEKLRAEFAGMKYSFTDEAVTISIGIATWQAGLSLENLFDHADSAMYTAKSIGKNRVESYESGEMVRDQQQSAKSFLLQ